MVVILSIIMCMCMYQKYVIYDLKVVVISIIYLKKNHFNETILDRRCSSRGEIDRKFLIIFSFAVASEFGD